MGTYLLTWNPAKWTWSELAEQVAMLGRGETVITTWTTGTRSNLPVGSRILLLRQGVEPRGIVALGESISAVTKVKHWNPARAADGDLANSINVRWECLSPIEGPPFISHEELATDDEFSSGHWEPYSSGTQLPDDLGARLADRIAERAGKPWTDPSETGSAFMEGRRLRVEVNRYERDRRAREACILHYGLRCAVCSFHFGDRYGELGEGFIHVHHLNPIGSGDGDDREVEPVRDLRPVCPNCHAMLHRNGALLSVEELRSRLVGG